MLAVLRVFLEAAQSQILAATEVLRPRRNEMRVDNLSNCSYFDDSQRRRANLQRIEERTTMANTVHEVTDSKPSTAEAPRPARHVCPWWLGYFLILPLRRLFENPAAALAPVARSGMKALDFGAGMGYFSLPLARLVAPSGRVVCVDVQEKMLRALRRRAERRGLLGSIETVLFATGTWPRPTDETTFDLALAFHVIHETPDAAATFAALAATLKPGGLLLFAEPAGHVSAAVFAEELRAAERAGLRRLEPVAGLARAQSAVLRKPDAHAGREDNAPSPLSD
jgi:2-polyprenyl-3-methyl-5-hydroxy-6-metoxy-1,4-benzoquinol methylase